MRNNPEMKLNSASQLKNVYEDLQRFNNGASATERMAGIGNIVAIMTKALGG